MFIKKWKRFNCLAVSIFRGRMVSAKGERYGCLMYHAADYNGSIIKEGICGEELFGFLR